MKRQDIEFFLAVLSYLLAIAEGVLKLGIFSWFYSVFGQTRIFYLLLIIGTAFTITFIIERIRKPRRLHFEIVRQRPYISNIRVPSLWNDYGVRWRLFEPLFLEHEPWADGPFCPKDDRELDEEIKGHIFKREVWKCPMCGNEYPKPKGDVKEMVEKNFAAYLRKNGEL